MLNVCLDVPVTTPSDIFIDLSILRSERIMSQPVDSSRETFFLGYRGHTKLLVLSMAPEHKSGYKSDCTVVIMQCRQVVSAVHA